MAQRLGSGRVARHARGGGSHRPRRRVPAWGQMVAGHFPTEPVRGSKHEELSQALGRGAVQQASGPPGDNNAERAEEPHLHASVARDSGCLEPFRRPCPHYSTPRQRDLEKMLRFGVAQLVPSCQARDLGGKVWERRSKYRLLLCHRRREGLPSSFHCKPSATRRTATPKGNQKRRENDHLRISLRRRHSGPEASPKCRLSCGKAACARREEHEDRDSLWAFRLGQLHAGRPNPSLGCSWWRGPPGPWDCRRRPRGHDLRGLGTGTGPTVEANGEVDFYSRNSNGDVAPEARFTNGMAGPVAMAFDPSGDLWVANINIGNVVELTRAQLTMPNPVPAVTITLPSGALALPTGLAIDTSGDVWVVDSGASQVVEYTKGQLAMSGAPTPHSTISISQLPGAPLGDMFDRKGGLWVRSNLSPSCPQGCVVEFSKADLALPNPTPTVTISSIGGANMAFTESGDMWMVTGGGGVPGTPYCFGTPCTNQLVKFTKHQLSTSGSPTPAVTINTTAADASGSMFGPYGVAVDPSGDVWVSNFNKPTTVEYDKHQVSRSGAPAPLRTIGGPDTQMNWPSYVLVEP